MRAPRWQQLEGHPEVLEEPAAAEEAAEAEAAADGVGAEEAEVEAEGAGEAEEEAAGKEAAPMRRMLQRTLTVEVKEFLQEFQRDGEAAAATGANGQDADGRDAEEAPLRELLDQWGRLERHKEKEEGAASPATPGKKKLQRTASLTRTPRTSVPGASPVSCQQFSSALLLLEVRGASVRWLSHVGGPCTNERPWEVGEAWPEYYT